jgi:oligopeptide transport system substrate-binding protein
MGAMELRAYWNDPLHLLEIFEEKQRCTNISFWENGKYQELLSKAKKSETLVDRNYFLQQAEALLAEEVPAIPLYQLTGNFLKRKGLKGVIPSKFFQIDIRKAYKEEEL